MAEPKVLTQIAKIENIPTADLSHVQGLTSNAQTQINGKAPIEQGIPSGGTTNQVLKKTSAADYAVEWGTVDSLPSQSGQSGKFLTTDGTTASWANAPAGVFIATYGTTTYAEITAALSEHKLPICIYSKKCYIYSYHETSTVLSNGYYFNYLRGNEYQSICVQPNNSWGGGGNLFQYQIRASGLLKGDGSGSISAASASDIPDLPTSKITSGTFADERIASASTWNAKLSNNGVITSTNISASTWVSDSTYSGYSYKCDIAISGCTSDHIPYVVFSAEDSISGNYASVVLSDTNKVTIYSKVNTSITIPSIQCIKAV